MAENWWEEDALSTSDTDETVSEGNWWEEDQTTTKPAPVVEEDAPDAISTQMYAGMSFKEAADYYEKLMQNPNVTPPPEVLGVRTPAYAIYTDPDTGKREYIPKPLPDNWTATGDAIITAIKAPFSDEVSLADAGEKFTNPPATVSSFDKVAMGLGESFGGAVETGAALAEKAGIEGALDFVDPLANEIDTGDSITDALLTDAVPAMAAAFAGGAGAQQIVQNMPRAIRGIAVVLAGEAAATSTVSTDEGNLIFGKEESTIFPIANGLDLGSSEADAVLEQRFNTLLEGMFLNSAVSAIATTAAGVASLASKFTILPLLSQGSQSAIERRVYEEITEKLAGITPTATPQERALIRDEIASIVEKNKKILVPRLTELSKDDTVALDTISALLRDVNDPVAQVRIGGLLTGQTQRGGQGAPKTIAATEQAQLELQQQMEAYLNKVGGETAVDQTATIANAADELATEARTIVGSADQGVPIAREQFDKATQDVVDGIKAADIELGGQISRLEDITGTDIVTGQSASFDEIRNGLMNAKKTMSEQKDLLYDAIPEGTPFNVEAFGEALTQATADLNAFDDVGKQILSKRLITTLRNAYSKTKPAAGVDAFGMPVEGVEAVPIEQVIQEIVDSGVDFKVLYNTIKPELSKLADEAYRNGKNEVGSRLVTLRKSIDEQVEWIAENGAPEAAEAATKAKDYFQNTFAPIWRDGGSMEAFGDMYDPVLIKGTGTSGFMEQSRDLVTGILSGNNADAVVNMKNALAQVQDPKPIADYMIADVINGFAASVRSDKLSADTLKGMSDRLRQYAVSLNEAFPDRARQINTLVSNIENAAGQERLVQQALQQAEELATQTRKEVRDSELGKFLSNLYGQDMATNVNPEDVFKRIFRESEGKGTIEAILNRANALPEARASVIKDGLEVAYLRHLSDRIKGAKMQSGGSQSLKGASVDKIIEEADSLLSVGRSVFSDKPEIMETITTLLETARLIEKQKQAQPVAGMSPTVFNQEATKATNRLIMTFVGPLTRTGAKIRSLAGAAFDYLDSGQRAALVLDNIIADPDYFLELSRKYNRHPLDPVLQENMITALVAGGTKTVNAEVDYLMDQNNTDQEMEELLGYK